MNVRRHSRGLRSDRQGPLAYSEASQPVFVPHGPHLFVSRKFATGGGGPRGCDSGAIFSRERHGRCLIVGSGKTENNAGDVVLSVRRKSTYGVKRPLANGNEGSTLALGDAWVRKLLEAPAADTVKGARDRAILATLLYHGMRRELQAGNLSFWSF